MSGSGEETKSEQSVKAPKMVRPYIRDYLANAQELSDQPYQGYGGEELAPFSPYQQQYLDQIGQIAGGPSPNMNAANAMVGGTLGGDYLEGNPYIDRMIGTAQGDIVDQFNTQVQPNSVYEFAKYGGGNVSNTGLMQTDAMNRFSLARALGDVESQIRLPAYQAERQRQMQAVPLALALGQEPYQRAGALQGAGAMQQMQGQRGLDIAKQRFLEERAYPYQQLDVMGQAIPIATGGGNFRVQTGSSQQPGMNPWQTGIGAGLVGMDLASSFFGNPAPGALSGLWNSIWGPSAGGGYGGGGGYGQPYGPY